MKLEPYLFFYGRCEEALAFYKSALGGDYEINRFEGSPMADHVTPENRQKVLHATFTGNGFSFMAGDGDLSKTLDPDAGNVSLSLGTTDKAEGERIFQALSDGGKVIMPLGKSFWSGTFGMLADRFGTEWMISIE